MNTNFMNFQPTSTTQSQPNSTNQPVYHPSNNTSMMNNNNSTQSQVLTNITNLQPNTQPLTQDFKPHDLQQSQFQQVPLQQSQPSNQVFPADNTTPSEQMYTKYEDLPNFGNNVDIVSVVNLLKMHFEDKNNWKNPFDALDNLRILNKYYPNELNNIVSIFWKYIVECIEKPKTFIAKNALIFVTEIFMNSKNVRLNDDIIMGLVPHVLSKASSDKGFVKKEAQSALKELTVNCCYDSTIVILCQQTLDKNPAIGDIAILTLAQVLNNIGENMSKLNPTTLIGLTKTMAKTLDTGKHANMKKYATMVCNYICRLFGLDNYINLIKGSNLSQSEELAMSKSVEGKKDSKRASGLFQEFVQERKKLVRMSQMSTGSNFQDMQGGFGSNNGSQQPWQSQGSNSLFGGMQGLSQSQQHQSPGFVPGGNFMSGSTELKHNE